MSKCGPSVRVVSLEGTWSCQLDPADVGAIERWATKALPLRAHLPGSLDEAGLGTPYTEADMGGFSRKVKHVGPAWFCRTVRVPDASPGESVVLRIERAHWFCQPWVEGTALEQRNSLSAPQEWDLTRWKGAEVQLALRIDNSPHIPIGRFCHAITDWTQTNWNGVIGEISLHVRQGNVLQDLSAASTAEGLEVSGTGIPHATVVACWGNQKIEATCGEGGRFLLLAPKEDLPPWSDDSPKLVDLKLECGGQNASLMTGWRRFEARGKTLCLNGLPTYLRGTLDACVFPQTGYPPMTIEPWLEIMTKAKSFGLNHLRFHSWCPPEAAFAAADAAGMIFQVELPLWTGRWALTSDASLLDFCRREAFRILKAYGSHPSFCLFALGNEMAFFGEEPEVDLLLRDLRAAYPHILFTFSSHGTHLSDACDFYVQADNGKYGSENKPLRGSTWFGVGSRFDRESPSTTTDCTEAADEFDRPVIAHEVGEWAVFPQLSISQDLTGVLEARNLDAIGGQLAKSGMREQADDFTFASGKLSAALYKEEMETLLRTKGVAGVQLLGLLDFPGQGTATVGMLDSLWRDKGFITGAEFSEFSASTVPLMRSPKRSWTTEESLEADLLVFHAGSDVSGALEWCLTDSDDTVVAHGFCPSRIFGGAAPSHAGDITVPLTGVKAPQKLQLRASLEGLGQNRWDMWVFPSNPDRPSLGAVEVLQWPRPDVYRALRSGKTVWLKIHPDSLLGGIPGRFAPAFWSPIHFKEQVGTMGCLIQSDHPMFAEFPTESHSDWQWWDVLTRSKSLVLDRVHPDFRPELQVIDRYDRNHKLGTIFEARVGPGRLLVTTIDFTTGGRPAAAQLEASLSKHLANREFEPKQSLTFDEVELIFEAEP